MAINKAMRAALKALSYPDIDIKKTYKLERQMKNLASSRLLNSILYKNWDHKISCGDHEVPVRIFPLQDGVQHPVLLFFHGGGWVTGNIDSYDKVCTSMAKMTGHVVVSVDYRLAPEYRFPSATEDCYAVAREIFLNNSLLDTKPQEITLIGDSAGGNLAAAVSLMARDRGEFLPTRQILIYPATANDHSAQSPFPSVQENGTDYLLTSKRVCDFMELYQSAESDLQNPYFAPLMADSFANQPDTLIVTAQYCPLRDEGEQYGEKLQEAGNQVEIHQIADALHGFFSLPTSFSQVKKTYEIINRFLNQESISTKIAEKDGS